MQAVEYFSNQRVKNVKNKYIDDMELKHQFSCI